MKDEVKSIVKRNISGIIVKHKLENDFIKLLKTQDFEDFILSLPFEDFEEEYNISKEEVIKFIKDKSIENLLISFSNELVNNKPFDENFAMAHYCLCQKLLLRKSLN